MAPVGCERASNDSAKASTASLRSAGHPTAMMMKRVWSTDDARESDAAECGNLASIYNVVSCLCCLPMFAKVLGIQIHSRVS